MSDDDGGGRRRLAARAMWLALAAPALAQLALLLYTVGSRLAYPYDLEWMEGGLLGHAARIAERRGIYVEPSIEFIPYLYTPLYPALVALLGGVFGISYALGRTISLLALLATIAFVIGAIVRQPDVPAGAARPGVARAASWSGAIGAVGLLAATYPWLEGWFDLVRADMLFVAMVTGGLLGIRAWARVPGPPGRRRVGAAAGVLALSFFCKQTGVFYVAAGGVALLVLAWRRLPIYVAVSGVLGLGGTWLFNRASGGWFWTYAFEVHQTHDFNRDRLFASFGHILGHFPVMTALIAAGLGAVAVTWFLTRRRPPGSAALLYWSPLFGLSCVVGAVGWATQWAHFNAFLPAMTTGAVAAGAAIPAAVGAAAQWRRWPAWWGGAVGLAMTAALAAQLCASWWRPARFIPTARDRAAGDALIARLRAVEGEVYVPYHPWYAVLAGKPQHAHRMGLLDMMGGKRWRVVGLREAFASQRFAAVVLDDRPLGPELAGLRETYKLDDILSPAESPRLYTGAIVQPRSVWVPNRAPTPPPGTTVLFDFESGRADGWRITGDGWGRRPVTGPLGKQGPVRRYGGRYYLSSYHGGDAGTGTMTSPSFTLAGSRITLRISGGRDERTLRAELWVDGALQKVSTGNLSEGMDEVVWNVASFSGRSGQIVLTDRADGPWGHLNVDEIWMRE